MNLAALKRKWSGAVAPIESDRDLTLALAIEDNHPVWLAVHQVINRAEQECIEGARRFVENTNKSVFELGCSAGACIVRERSDSGAEQCFRTIQTKMNSEIRQTVTVTAIPMNKRMVEALDVLGNHYMVDVGKSDTFAVGDQIEVGPHESGYADVWALLSQVPRDKRRPIEDVVSTGPQPDLVD